jgi:hypothetical protein
MASEIALDAMAKSVERQRILDPMCGSGTVLVKGSRLGHSVTGFDLDPLAILMSRVATSHAASDSMGDTARALVDSARRSRATALPWRDDETQAFARYWFGETQISQLVKLSKHLNALPTGATRDALQIALSRTIVTKTPQASLAADTAHSRPHRVLTTSTYDVFEGFLKSVDQLARQLDTPKSSGRVKVIAHDARDPKRFGRGVFDLVITSPPYLNAIDYLRGHRLALIWLGHTVVALRELRSTTIGSEVKLPSSENPAQHLELIRGCLRSVASPELLPKSLLARYVRDMSLLAANVEACLVPGGRAIFVVADSRVRGNLIPTGEIVATCLEAEGLKRKATTVREIPESARYLPVSKAGEKLGLRMRHEQVITVTKAQL